jgi:hypothetical protein
MIPHNGMPIDGFAPIAKQSIGLQVFQTLNI